VSQHLQVSYADNPTTSPLLRSVPTCAYCDRPLAGGRRYLCQVCQPAPLRTRAADYDWTPGPDKCDNQADCDSSRLDRLPYIDLAGNLITPLDCPARYRWWQGGQSPIETLRELGAPAEMLARYTWPGERL